jgi:hypothetical protein
LSRWRVGALAGTGSAHDLGDPRWSLELLRCRGGRPQRWDVTWRPAAERLDLDTAERSDFDTAERSDLDDVVETGGRRCRCACGGGRDEAARLRAGTDAGDTDALDAALGAGPGHGSP